MCVCVRERDGEKSQGSKILSSVNLGKGHLGVYYTILFGRFKIFFKIKRLFKENY